MRSVAFTSGILALCGVAFAQSDQPPQAFSAADVHTSPRGVRESPLYAHGNRFELHGVTMLRLITMAYGINTDKVAGGPNWLDTDRFDIVAATEARATPENLKPMLQALLAERFQLKVRHEDKQEPIYALVVVKKVPLKENPPGEPQCKRGNDDGYISLNCQNVTFAYLASHLPGMAPNYFDRPVVDETGLTGSYEIQLKWTGRGQLGGNDPDHPGISLLTYFEKQLGIKAEPRTRPVPGLVIESVNQSPSPNPPGTLEKLPAPVTEFEVAEIRASKPGVESRFEMKNGRIEALAIPMRDLIGFAYNLDDYMLPSAEKWLDSDRFDLIAKTDPSVTDGTLQVMLRTLLEERFHLKSHFEEQPITVWALTAPKGKAKLKDTSGEEHAGCTRTPRDGAFNYACHNTTLAQFVQKLPDVGGTGGYIGNHPLVDLTGLKGSYDFDITWSPPARAYGSQKSDGLPPAAGGATSTATGGLTLFEAIDKQLGLKLAEEKHPMTVVVIDHVDRTPTDN